MLYNEENVRDNIRNREGRRVFFLGSGDQLTSAARDYLTREKIEILPGRKAAVEEYRSLDGGIFREKPEHMTHLNGTVLVSKAHPRIGFRGKMDLLEAELILAQIEVPRVKDALEEILQLARNLIGWDVMEEPAEEGTLCGLTQQEQRMRSHFPQKYYGIPHFMPSAVDGPDIARVNRLRCMARQAELAAVEAFSDREGNPTRTDLLRALNRMSSMLYILMIEMKAGKL